jgi:hypothetical protein
MTAPEWIGAALTALVAVWDARHATGAVATRVAGLGGNLGPRVERLEQQVAWLQGAAGIKPPAAQTENDGR